MKVKVAQAELDSIITAWCFYDTRCVNYKPKQISAACSGLASGSSGAGVDDRTWTDWAWMRVVDALNLTEHRQLERHLLESAIKHIWRDGGSRQAPSLRIRCSVEKFQDHLAEGIVRNPLLRV